MRDTDAVGLIGTWMYASSIPTKVRIVRMSEKPGSGDHEDAAEVRDDQAGIFYRVDYGSTVTAGHFNASGGHYTSKQDAVAAAEAALGSITWAHSS